MSPMLKPCGPEFGPNLPPNGSNLGLSCGAKLEPSGPGLGGSWAKLTPSGADVAAMSDRNGAFGRCWADLQKLQIITVP